MEITLVEVGDLEDSFDEIDRPAAAGSRYERLEGYQ